MYKVVDAPEKAPEGEIGWPLEGQRVYKVWSTTDPSAKEHTVRIRRDPERAAYGYVVENLVGGKWHRLLEGETTNRAIPFDAAAARASAVLT